MHDIRYYKDISWLWDLKWFFSLFSEERNGNKQKEVFFINLWSFFCLFCYIKKKIKYEKSVFCFILPTTMMQKIEKNNHRYLYPSSFQTFVVFLWIVYIMSRSVQISRRSVVSTWSSVKRVKTCSDSPFPPVGASAPFVCYHSPSPGLLIYWWRWL